jgi:hypothetical protein
MPVSPANWPRHWPGIGGRIRSRRKGTRAARVRGSIEPGTWLLPATRGSTEAGARAPGGRFCRLYRPEDQAAPTFPDPSRELRPKPVIHLLASFFHWGFATCGIYIMFKIGEVPQDVVTCSAAAQLRGSQISVLSPQSVATEIRDEMALADSPRCIRLRSGQWNLAGGLHKFVIRRLSPSASSGK